MYCSSFVRRVPAALLCFAIVGAAACADKNADANKAGAASDSTRRVAGGSAAGDVVASNAQASATPGQQARAGTAQAQPKDAELPQGVYPKRSHQDSVALASMTSKKDSLLDAKWPVKMPAPLPGAVFPANRVVAFYGNPLSKGMGVLGEYPKDQMLGMLDREVSRWAKADPSHPVIPALHLIITVAQGAPGKTGLYRTQHRDTLAKQVYSWIKAKKGLMFLDVQVGKSHVQAEVPRLAEFLSQPDIHLAVDPEFAMATSGAVPGTKIGTLDAKDINWCIQFLDSIARARNLPPKVLIVHRFTRKMVTNAKDIRPTPHVQVVMDMDGWGPPWLKFDSYHDYIKAEPVEFTGFKLFFKNDIKKGDPLLTPGEVLRLNPRPLYIQYQ